MTKLAFSPDKPPYELVQDNKRVKELARQFAKAKTLGVDVEATGLDPYTSELLLLQIGVDDQAYLFDPLQVDLSLLKPPLSASQPLKIVQNASFDYKFIKHHLGITLGNLFDTMLAERMLTAGLSRNVSLAAMSEKYLGVKMDKEVRKSFVRGNHQFNIKQLEYAALDVLVLPHILSAQLPLLEKEDLMKVAHLEFQTVPVVAEMELKGIRLDIQKWQEIFAYEQKERDRAEDKIQELLAPLYKRHQANLFGGTSKVVNLNSPKQVLEAFQLLGVDVPSTGEAVLKKTNHALAKLLLDYRTHEKLISAFGDSLLEKVNPVTKRIHPSFSQIGADTGRFSCSDPNLQQIPATARFRECFIPADGYTFVVADYSQQELRVLAGLTNDPLFLKAYREDLDLHSLTASQMFGVPFKEFKPTENPEHKKLRQSAKTINFGIAYGMGPGALGALLGVSVEDARGMLSKYVQTYKGVKRWLDKVGKEALYKGYSETIIGRKRWYHLPSKDDVDYIRVVGNIERQGKNTPIQGSSADMTKFALIYMYKKFQDEQLVAVPILAIHDEVVVEVSQADAPRVRDIVEAEMIRAGEEMLPQVPVKAEAKITNVWEH